METITILENNQELILEVLDTFLYKGVQYIIYQDNEEIVVRRLEDVING